MFHASSIRPSINTLRHTEKKGDLINNITDEKQMSELVQLKQVKLYKEKI